MGTFKNFTIKLSRSLGSSKENRHFDQHPIIIGGCGRSGTTLLLSILSAHPDVFAIPYETVGLMKWGERFPDGASSDKQPVPIRIDRIHRYLMLRSIPAEARRWCEKTPRNVRHIENILNYWENARFINIIRDPRDVLTSRHRKDPDAYWVPLNRWVRDVQEGMAYHDHPRVYTVRYEDLVQKFEPTIREMCAFLDIEVVPQILDWHNHTMVRRNQAWKGKVVKLHTDSVKKWERPEHAERLAEIMADERITGLMNRLDYQI